MLLGFNFPVEDIMSVQVLCWHCEGLRAAALEKMPQQSTLRKKAFLLQWHVIRQDIKSNMFVPDGKSISFTCSELRH